MSTSTTSKSCCSWAWKKILQLRAKVRLSFWWRIGDGLSTSLWFDNWHPRGPLNWVFLDVFIYNSGLSREASVADLYAKDGQALRSVFESWEIPLPSPPSLLTKIAFAGRIIRWGSRWPRRGRPLGGRSPEFYGIVSFGTMPLHPGTNFTFDLSPSIGFPPKLSSSLMAGLILLFALSVRRCLTLLTIYFLSVGSQLVWLSFGQPDVTFHGETGLGMKISSGPQPFLWAMTSSKAWRGFLLALSVIAFGGIGTIFSSKTSRCPF